MEVRHKRNMLLRPTCPEHAMPAAGVGVIVEEPGRGIKLLPRAKPMLDLICTGRLGVSQVCLNGGGDYRRSP